MDISNYEERLEELNELEDLTGDEGDELDLLQEVENLVELRGYDLAALQAYLDLGNDNLDDFEEAYRGKYDNDEDFVQQLLEDTEPALNDLPSYIYIDWEKTASDIMMDYAEENGYYFRTL
jgi:antirestriction protein